MLTDAMSFRDDPRWPPTRYAEWRVNSPVAAALDVMMMTLGSVLLVVSLVVAIATWPSDRVLTSATDLEHWAAAALIPGWGVAHDLDGHVLWPPAGELPPTMGSPTTLGLDGHRLRNRRRVCDHDRSRAVDRCGQRLVAHRRRCLSGVDQLAQQRRVDSHFVTRLPGMGSEIPSPRLHVQHLRPSDVGRRRSIPMAEQNRPKPVGSVSAPASQRSRTRLVG